MEEEGSTEQTREVYERAVANVPPIKVNFMKIIINYLFLTLLLVFYIFNILFVIRKNVIGEDIFICG